MISVLIVAGLLLVGCWTQQSQPANDEPDAGGIDDQTDTGSDSDSDADADTDTETATETETECADVPAPEGCARLVAWWMPAGGDGLSWCTAFNDIGDGIYAAHEAGSAEMPCQVWVAAGSYYGYDTGPSDSFALASGVELLGGFAGDESFPEERDPGLYETILSGWKGPGETSRVYHVVTGFDDAVIDGFTIRGGSATGYELEETVGGGMLNNEADVIVRNCIFEGNEAENGAGMFNFRSTVTVSNCVFRNNGYHGSSSPSGGGAENVEGVVIFEGCVFDNNSIDSLDPAASATGGGMSNFGSDVSVVDCDFLNNSAMISSSIADSNAHGGAIFSRDSAMFPLMEPIPTILRVEGCLFENNSSDDGGGLVNWFSEAELINNVFKGNVAASTSLTWGGDNGPKGGAVYLLSGETQIDRCTFVENDASNPMGDLGAGGAIHAWHDDVRITNSLFADNFSERGGALAVTHGATGTVVNATFTGNESYKGGAVYAEATQLDVENCIFWENPAEPLYFEAYYDPEVTVSHCDVEGGWEGDGNLDIDPLFVDPGSGDYGLMDGSPGIDRANGMAAPATDMVGNVRYDDPVVGNYFECPDSGVDAGPDSGLECVDYADIGALERVP